MKYIPLSLSWPLLPWKRKPLGAAAVGVSALTINILANSTVTAFAKRLSESLSPYSLLFVGEVLTLLFIVLSFGLLPILKDLIRLKKIDRYWIAFIVLLTGAFAPLLWYTGISMTTAVNAGFFGRTELVFLLLLGQIFLQEKITSVHLTAMAAILTGVSIISFEGFTNGLFIASGDIFIVLAMLTYAVAHILFRRYSPHLQPHILVFARACTGIFTALFLSALFHHPLGDEVSHFPVALLPVLFAYGFISRFLSNLSFYAAIERLKMQTVSFFSSFKIIGTVGFAYLFLGETLHWYHTLGGVFIILGTIAFELLSPHQEEEHETELRLKQRVA